MKAELVKRQDRWDLYGEDGSKIASSAPNPIGKLSTKNCEAIANGYDLDELAKNIKTEDGFEHKQSFIAGFQKAFEILGDKKFSEDDLRLAMHFGKFGEANGQTTTIGFIKSLQQTEWDVEIETEIAYCKHTESCKAFKQTTQSKDPFCFPFNCEDGNELRFDAPGIKNKCVGYCKPKLDSNGFLILKRI